MPTYEYFCEKNQQTVEVLHGMEEMISTWGALCALSGDEVGNTSGNASVQRKLSAVSLLPKKGASSANGGGCCGGGCGCSGH